MDLGRYTFMSIWRKVGLLSVGLFSTLMLFQNCSGVGNARSPNSINADNVTPSGSNSVNPLSSVQVCTPYSQRGCSLDSGTGAQSCSGDGSTWSTCAAIYDSNGYLN